MFLAHFACIVAIGFLSARSQILAADQKLSKVHARLEQSAAELRRQQIEDPSYKLKLDLPETDTLFHGDVTISFKFKPQGKPLRLDFAQGEILTLAINGQVKPFDYDGTAVYLAENLLQAGERNAIAISYRHAYSKDGTGLYWFKDPLDGKAYTYTNFEPYEANKLFPCFDQPDLKATYELSVKAPKAWTVVSAMRETQVSLQGAHKLWEFPQSLKFSTYVFSMHAGPYKVLEDLSFRIPLRLMVRQSMAPHLPSEEWFAATRHGFDFFDKYLGFSYPFSKYDQVVVPDFNSGAMENVAAVTFSERFLLRGQRSKADQQKLVGTILHEMAHMWFGDLVTMRWWNDLWLNESFATYASSLAMANLPGYAETWLTFNRSKGWAYYADELVTTHPIVAPVPHTDGTSFDGITYSKGAAFLKQLHFVLGDENFQKGLKIYFHEHAFNNTELLDFVKAMEQASKRSLKAFAEVWLQSAGVNTLEAQKTCVQNRIASFELLQTASPEQPDLREHRTVIALYKSELGQLRLIKEAAITYFGSKTLWAEAVGFECPDVVILNQGDHDYVKTKFDADTLKFLTLNLQSLRDPLQRMMVWSAVADRVARYEISLADFVQFSLFNWPQETDYDVLQAINARADREIFDSLQWVPDLALRDKLIAGLSQMYLTSLESRVGGPDLKKLSFDGYLRMLIIGKKSAAVLAILQNQISWPQWQLEPDVRWQLIKALSELGYPKAKDLADLELKSDSSNRAKQSYLSSQAASPNFAQKMKLLKPILEDKQKITSAERLAIMGSLFPKSQNEQRNLFAAIFKQNVKDIVRSKELGLARSYVRYLLPESCDGSTLPLLQDLIAMDFPKSIHENILQAQQAVQRCQKVMARLVAQSRG